MYFMHSKMHFFPSHFNISEIGKYFIINQQCLSYLLEHKITLNFTIRVSWIQTNSLCPKAQEMTDLRFHTVSGLSDNNMVLKIELINHPIMRFYYTCMYIFTFVFLFKAGVAAQHVFNTHGKRVTLKENFFIFNMWIQK